jgi:hypothetical protein
MAACPDAQATYRPFIAFRAPTAGVASEQRGSSSTRQTRAICEFTGGKLGVPSRPWIRKFG